MARTRWLEIATKHLRAVPKGATKAARGAALKAASREYRGGGRRATRSNPAGMSWGKLVIYGVVGYFAYKALTKPAAVKSP